MKKALKIFSTPQQTTAALTSRKSSLDSSHERPKLNQKKLNNLIIGTFIGDLPYGEKSLSYRKDIDKWEML